MMHAAPTLDDLNSLNHEIAALVKAGVPLELGLRGIASIEGSQLSRLADRIATRLARGQELPEALSEEGPIISPVYAAVMRAGLSSGKLPEALESLVISSQIIQETRRQIWLAMIYPAICATMALLILSFFIESLAPRILMVMETFPPSWPIQSLKWLHLNRYYLLVFFPLGFVSFCILLTLASRSLLGFLTPIRGLIDGDSLNWSQFTELLALQVEQGVPLPEAFVQAADATSNQEWRREARTVAEKLKQGKTLYDSLKSAVLLPPVVRWMLASGEKQGLLTKTLRQLTDLYRRRALRQASIVKIWLPVTITLVFTVGLGLTYGLAFFIPLRSLLFELMKE